MASRIHNDHNDDVMEKGRRHYNFDKDHTRDDTESTSSSVSYDDDEADEETARLVPKHHNEGDDDDDYYYHQESVKRRFQCCWKRKRGILGFLLVVLLADGFILSIIRRHAHNNYSHHHKSNYGIIAASSNSVPETTSTAATRPTTTTRPTTITTATTSSLDTTSTKATTQTLVIATSPHETSTSSTSTSDSSVEKTTPATTFAATVAMHDPDSAHTKATNSNDKDGSSSHTATNAISNSDDNNDDKKDTSSISSISQSSQTKIKLAYSVARTDRAGSVILDLMYHHAYCFHHGCIYGGSCNVKNRKISSKQRDVQKLLRVVGLDAAMPLACPDQDHGTNHNDKDNDDNNNVQIMWLEDGVAKKEFRRQNTQKLEAWKQALREIAAKRLGPENVPWNTTSNKGSSQLQIAVHVRRGDVAPCSHRGGSYDTTGGGRYISNVFYQRTVEQIVAEQYPTVVNNATVLPDNIQVTVFSEGVNTNGPQYYQYEPLEDFARLGYQLDIGGSVTNVWKAIIQADVAIISNSAFSVIPAFFKFGNGRVIYFDEVLHDFPPQPSWQPANPDIIQQAKAKTAALRREHCPWCAH